MRLCANCVLLQQRISDLNNELFVLRIAAVAGKIGVAKQKKVGTAFVQEARSKPSRISQPELPRAVQS